MSTRMFTIVTISLLSFSLANRETIASETFGTVERIQANGYPSEKHKVETIDGYILELHRIPQQNLKSPIVFLMHGFLSSSDAFITMGPKYGAAYIFADEGFDVWMGNARGTKYSRNHTTLDPDDEKEKYNFFNFTFEDIGINDISTSVDYILDITKKDKLHYIGHSQGGTVFLVLNSMKPEYNDKFKSAHLLAGVGYQEHFPNKVLADMAKKTNILYGLAIKLGIVELFPPHRLNDIEEFSYQSKLCVDDIEMQFFCDHILFTEILGDNYYRYSTNISLIAGASVKQLAHYGQNIRDKAFRRWNYGSEINFIKYGRLEPPTYDLGLITANVTLHYSVSDNIVHELDIIAMAEDMRNATIRMVPKRNFKHTDFVVSKAAKELVTNYVIRAILDIEKGDD